MSTITTFNDEKLEQKLEGLKPGDHLCCIYETDEEHRALLTPFMTQGLDQGEKVVYIVDVRTSDDVLGYLREEGLDVERYLKAGQLRVLSAAESYTRETVFDPDGMISLLESETGRALAEGFSALRVTGEMTWALRGLPGSDRLLEYEAKLNEFFPQKRCLAICQYDKRRFKPGLLMDILAAHPLAVIGTRLFDNFYYMPCKDLLGPDPEAARLNNWLHNLDARRQGEDALREARDELESRVQARTRQLARANEKLKLEIDQRKRAQMEIAEAEFRYRTVADFAYDWEYWQAPDGALRYVSPSCECITGHRAEEFIDNPGLLKQLILPEDRGIWSDHRRQAKEEHRPREIQFRIRTRDGEIRWIEHACQPVRGPQDEFLGFRASNRDITARKEA
ncbi:MAG: MEDS domain-containing protein, partial [Planctomycetota bacterium]